MEILARVSDECEANNEELLINLKKISSNIFKKSWSVDPRLLDHLSQHRPVPYNRKELKSLLRVIRNTERHFVELPDILKKELFGKSKEISESVFLYFEELFPNLFLNVHLIIQKNSGIK